jgi:hypothetical protein
MPFFSWIRSKVRAAVLAGLGDAAAELDAGDGPEVAEAVARLQARIQPALPAPAPEPAGGVARGRKRGAE